MNILRVLEFVFKNIRRNKSRFLVILLGIIFAISLVISVFIWADTTERIIIQEFQNETDYLFSVTSFMPNTIQQILNYISTNDLVDSSDVALQTNAIFNIADKNESYRFFPIDKQEDLDNPVIISNALLSNITAFEDNIAKIFDITGNYPKNDHEIVITEPLLHDLKKYMGQDIGIGSELNMSIARRFPFTDRGDNQLISFNPKYFDNFTISGILKYRGGISITTKIHTETSMKYTVLTSIENMNQNDLQIYDTNGIRIYGMLQFDQKKLDDVGIQGMTALYKQLETQIKSRFWTAITIELSKETRTLKDEFQFSFNSIYYYLPLIILSLLLSDQASSILLDNRKQQISTLKTKGATRKDLFKILSTEFILISILGAILGVFSSIFLSAIISSITEDTTIDIGMIRLHLNAIQINISTIYFSILIIISIFVITSLIKIQVLLQNGKLGNLNLTINFRNMFATEKTKFSTRLIGLFKFKLDYSIIQVAKFLGTLILSSIIFILSLEMNVEGHILEISQNDDFRISLALIIISFNLLWLFYFQYLATFVYMIIRAFFGLFKILIPKKSFLLIKSFQTKEQSNKLIVFYILFLLTLITMSSTLNTIYVDNDNRTNEFLKGADLRIHTSGVYCNFTDVLDRVDGISMSTGIYETDGRIVGSELSVYVIDPEKYAKIGYWDDAYVNGNVESLLKSLDDGFGYNIIMSSEFAHLLNYNPGDVLYLGGFEHSLILNLTIQGFIDSAPALGISWGSNLELGQDTDGWTLLPYSLVNRNFNISTTDLFLASIEEGANIQEIMNELKQIEGIIAVNPDQITESQILDLINIYLPSSIAILILIKLIAFVFTFLLIDLILNTILEKRKREIAILIGIGNPKKHVKRTLQAEFLIIGCIATIIATINGVLMANVVMNFFVQFTIKRIYVPIQFTINPVTILSNSALVFIIYYGLFLVKSQRLIKKAKIWD